MSLFGIPIFVSTEMIDSFLLAHFPLVSLTPNEEFYVFLALNAFYLWFYLRILIPLMYKALMFALNHIF